MDFDDYVRTRGPALVRLGRLLTGDRHQGEDLVQDVLARAFVRWERIAADGQPDAYLRRALVNASISRWRRPSAREVAVAAPEDSPDPVDLGAAAAERDAVWRLIRGLPAKQRAAVVLRYYEDLDDAAIAALLNCSQPTVRSQVKRALDTLRARIEPDRALNGGRA
ncbi:SigE family RNA polymerase sigma factor [Dactylosporangium sp. CS-047395]|uniref:SigE family RNA polymerase sigma factor n=1 Tax=Dactylosporangium sp. CS-047395 TaxID=3239936 RepID=UPI003D9083C6